MDAADLAQRDEAHHLAAALSALQNSTGEKQLQDESGRIVCLDCDEPIPVKRLGSIPDAVRCVECQEAWEECPL